VRQRLVWFVNIMLSYVIETVIQPTTADMRGRIAEAVDIDTMVKVHGDFVTKLQTRCLLAKNLAPIHDSILSMLDLAVVYSDSQARRLGRQTARSRFESTKKPNLKPRQRVLRRNQKDSEEDPSSDEEDAEDDYDADNETSSSRNESHDERLRKIQDQFGQVLNFTIAGLKGVSRVGGEIAWEMLAERLEWGSDRVDA
jgi:gamma-tubulin complex component 5